MRINSIDPLVCLSLVRCLELELPIIATECYRKVMHFSLLGTFGNLAMVQIKVYRALVLILTIFLLVVSQN